MANRAKRPKVYISGPISKGDQRENFNRFMSAHRRLIMAGFAPINPGLTMHEDISSDFDHETWLEVDLPWVEAADVLIRLPGESAGADVEVRAAVAAGVEVFCAMDWCPVGVDVFSRCIDPVFMASMVHSSKMLWCQGDGSCPPEHRHRWPEHFAPQQTQEDACVPDVLLKDYLATIREERGKVYGEPRANHQGIAMMWAPMLEPHWEAIKNQQPLPEHVIALLMCLLKIDRMRLCFHADNYDDLANYAAFAREWQSTEGGAA